MKLTSIGRGNNGHVLELDNGNEVLFSYETPVAVALEDTVWVEQRSYTGVYKTAEKFSKTTSAHINTWTDTTKTLPHAEFLALVNAAISSR